MISKFRRARLSAAAAVAVSLLVAGCSDNGDSADTTAAGEANTGAAVPGGDGAGPEEEETTQEPAGEAVEPVQATAEDWQEVADTLGADGKLMGGSVYRIGFPRSDLSVTSKGVAVEPGLALGSYAAFARYPDTTMVMGDLVVTEEELQKVTTALQENGISQTAVHKHLLAHSPPIWWTHFEADGDDPVELARGVRAALDETATPESSEGSSAGQEPDLDTAAIDDALGAEGTNDGGIYKFSFARTETVTMHGRVLPAAMGVTTAISFQPTGDGKAVVNGDFVITADEIQDVIQALREGEIDIVELHNHTLGEQPRLFYMHFWANKDAIALANSLAEAVEATDVQPAG